MIADVSGILKEFGGIISIDGDVNMPDQNFLGEMYRFLKPLNVKGTISNNGKSLILNASCTGKMRTDCARCMKDIEVSVDFTIDENLAANDGTISPDDDVILFEGNKVNIDEIVINNFIMKVPGKYLCKDDCRGLCQNCGADLNEGDCGCNHDDIDPRWEGLANIMKNNS